MLPALGVARDTASHSFGEVRVIERSPLPLRYALAHDDARGSARADALGEPDYPDVRLLPGRGATGFDLVELDQRQRVVAVKAVDLGAEPHRTAASLLAALGPWVERIADLPPALATAARRRLHFQLVGEPTKEQLEGFARVRDLALRRGRELGLDLGLQVVSAAGKVVLPAPAGGRRRADPGSLDRQLAGRDARRDLDPRRQLHLASTFPTWYSTVRAVMWSSRPISLLVMPLATSRATDASRAESALGAAKLHPGRSPCERASRRAVSAACAQPSESYVSIASRKRRRSRRTSATLSRRRTRCSGSGSPSAASKSSLQPLAGSPASSVRYPLALLQQAARCERPREPRGAQPVARAALRLARRARTQQARSRGQRAQLADGPGPVVATRRDGMREERSAAAQLPCACLPPPR